VPQSYYPLEPEQLELTRADGLPRVVRYRDETGAESLHVAYLPAGSDVLQTMLATNWPPPLPTDPTPAESAVAILARQQAQTQAAADAAQLRQQVLATLQSAVGVRFTDLTNAQLRAIVEALAWQAGALKPDTTVRSPADWIR
jgi:hypothetical protein